MLRPIRILFVLGSLGGGGTERQVLEILKRLDRQAFTPLLYLIYRTGELLSEVPADVPVLSFAERFQLPRVNWPGRLHGQHVRSLAQTIKQQRIDLVYDRTIHATLVAAPAAARSNVPHVSVVVNDPQLDLESSGQKFVFFKRIKLRQAYRLAARVFVVSEALKDSLKQYYGVPLDRLRTVYNLFDIDELRRRASAQGPQLESDRFHIVAAGRLQEQKGFGVLLDAMDMVVNRLGHRHVLLRILGTGPLEAQLQATIQSHRLQSHVRLEGFCPNPLPIYRQAQLFCLSSLFEGMPNALVEAIACGTPAVSTDCPSGPAEILAAGKLGALVPPGDPNALAMAMDDAIGNYASWKERTAAAEQHIRIMFGADVGMQRLTGELQQVLATEMSNAQQST